MKKQKHICIFTRDFTCKCLENFYLGFHIPNKLIIPSLYAANSRMESLKRSMKAAFITPFVSSFGFACEESREFFFKAIGNKIIAHVFPIQEKNPIQYWIRSIKDTSSTYIKIQKCIELILNNWKGFQKFFSIHCPHYTINPSKNAMERIIGKVQTESTNPRDQQRLRRKPHGSQWNFLLNKHAEGLGCIKTSIFFQTAHQI